MVVFEILCIYILKKVIIFITSDIDIFLHESHCVPVLTDNEKEKYKAETLVAF